MKRRLLSTTRLSLPLSTAFAVLMAAPAAFAATLYWDADGATPGAGGATPSSAWTTGGTSWSTSSNGTVATAATTTLSADDLVFSAGVNATGAFTASLTSAQDAGSLLFQEGTATISGSGGVINLGSAGGKVTVNNGAAALIGAATDTIIGGSGGLTKAGVGTLTLNGTAAHTFTGGLNVNGGTLALNYANMVTPTDMIGSGNALSLGGGRLLFTGNAAGTTSQTFGNVTVNSGGGSILGDKNGGTATSITLGTLTATASGGRLLVGAGGTAANAPVITTTSGTLTNGIYSGRAVFFNGTAATGYDWLTNTGGAGPAYTLSGLASGSYTALALGAGTDTNNSTISATATMTGSRTTNSLKFSAPASAQTLTIGAGNTLTLGSGGLLFTGASVAQGPRIAAGSLTAGNGSGSYDLVVHTYNVTAQNIIAGVTGANLALVNTISSNIVDNGANPVTLVKNGPGNLLLTGTNTSTGGIVVNEGNLGFNSAGAQNNNSITFNASSNLYTFSPSSTSGSITLNNNSQVTILNNNSSYTVTGKVTGTGGISLDKGGQGSVTVNLNATNNDFTGPVLFAHRHQNQSAHLTVNSLTDTTAAGEGNIVFGATPTAPSQLSVSHNFNYGSGAIAPLTLTNRRFELGTTQIQQQINNQSSQALTINSDVLVSGNTGKTLTLGGAGAGVSTFAGSIGNNAAPASGTTLLGLTYATGASSITLASVTGITPGSTISGTGIAAGTTITAVNLSTKAVTLSANTNGAGTIGQSMTVGGVTNSVSLAKTGTGTWVLTGTNTYTGATTVSAGTLAINGTGSINNSPIFVNGGTLRYNSSVDYTNTLTFTAGTLGGTNLNGALGGQTIGTNKILSPGNSVGSVVTTSQIWADGGSYLWEINDATGTAGGAAGWDIENGTGTLDVSATAGFSIRVASLTLANTPGTAANFNDASNYNWLIADFDNVTNFAVSDFTVNTSAFTNPFTGSFGVAQGGGSLPGDASQVYLTYTAVVPEPGAALLAGLGMAALLRRRRSGRMES